MEYFVGCRLAFMDVMDNMDVMDGIWESTDKRLRARKDLGAFCSVSGDWPGCAGSGSQVANFSVHEQRMAGGGDHGAVVYAQGKWRNEYGYGDIFGEAFAQVFVRCDAPCYDERGQAGPFQCCARLANEDFYRSKLK